MGAIRIFAPSRARMADRCPARLQGDDGSVIPLILGFFLLALLMVGGGVAFADVFTHQRNLQSLCDGAAIAAANNIDRNSVTSGDSGPSAPLIAADQLVRAYLDRDPAGRTVQVDTAVSTDRATVALTCRQHNGVAFGALIGKGGGVDQTVHSSAEAPLSS